MSSYDYDDNYDYGYSGYSRGSGRSSGWEQGSSGGRKRRGNFDQMQQYEQRRNNRQWRNNRGWGDYDNDWYGNESYDDGYYGGSHWDDDDHGYNDGYGNSRKRGRFYDDDHRGGQYMERGPHSVNFYDDYDDTYNRGSRRARSRFDGSSGRRPDSEYRWRSGSSYSERRSDSNPSYRPRRDSKRPGRASRKKSDAEDAIYEKHKKVTVERSKREKIANTVHAIITAFREVALKIAQEDHAKNAESTSQEVTPEATDNEIKSTVKEGDALDDGNSNEISSADENVESGNATAEDSNCDENKDKSENVDSQVEKTSTNGEKSNVEKPIKQKYEPVILSAIKCGESAMRILVGNTLQATVVVLTKKKPTRSLVQKSIGLLHEILANDKRMKDETVLIEYDDKQESLILKQESIEGFHVLIRFTSPECSADANDEDKDSVSDDPEDVLSEESCRAALVQLRRMRFFVKKLDSSPVSLTVLRILLYFRNTIVGWDKLPVWLALVLVNVAKFTLLGENPDPETERDLHRVDALLIRCLEILSSGVLLPNSPGIKDPCEVDKDAGEDLSLQDVEALTGAAQHVLRRVYFGQIRSVLDVELKV